jgi:beta-ureidopropionase / N-carbamoyl-L-amino-acid hydrolase
MRYAEIDAGRLWARQAETDRIGATPAGGAHRMALTPEDIASHRLIADWAVARGFGIALDDIGNMFVTRAGTEPDLPPVAAGSHTDSQPMAGRFDGMQGVLAAFEALEAIDDAGIRTRHPLTVAIWNNEEGPRFTPACMGSAVYAGVRTLDEVIGQRDPDGVALADCLDALGRAMPEAGRRALGAPFAAFLESHIEQGIELETSGNVIGIVTGMQGYRRWRIDVRGEDAHSGTMPVSRRRDAFVAATDMAVALRRAFADETDEMRFTIGRFEVRPGGISVVPGHVHFTVDMRHPSSATLRQQGNRVDEICRESAGRCAVSVEEFITSETLEFPDEIRALLKAAADRRGYPNQPIFSRASHDARHISRLCPAGMIFVPCKDGISHNEAESAKKEHCAAAAQVLADVMVELANPV